MSTSPPYERIRVKPVLFTQGISDGDNLEIIERLSTCLRAAREGYFALLNEQDTFEISGDPTTIIPIEAASDIWVFDHQDRFLDAALTTILARDNCNPENCPYVYAVVFAGGREIPGVGRGSPINGGVNTGGGIAMISNAALSNRPHPEFDMMHELGHAFGLIHTEKYNWPSGPRLNRFLMYGERSIFGEQSAPGRYLTDQDRVLLAHARKVFPDYYAANPGLRDQKDVITTLEPALLPPRKITGHQYLGPKIAP